MISELIGRLQLCKQIGLSFLSLVILMLVEQTQPLRWSSWVRALLSWLSWCVFSALLEKPAALRVFADLACCDPQSFLHPPQATQWDPVLCLHSRCLCGRGYLCRCVWSHGWPRHPCSSTLGPATLMSSCLLLLD